LAGVDVAIIAGCNPDTLALALKISFDRIK